MSSDVAFFAQDYWTNSLAIGHPLVYHSNANGEASVDSDKTHVGTNFISILF
jgi:hypothetical protein